MEGEVVYTNILLVCWLFENELQVCLIVSFILSAKSKLGFIALFVQKTIIKLGL